MTSEQCPNVPGRFLRRCGAAPTLTGLAFAAGVLATTLVLMLYAWPRVNTVVFNITVQPVFTWFGLILPAVLLGALAVRWHWFAVGLAFWIISLLMTCDGHQVFKPGAARARAQFAALHFAHRSFLKHAGADNPLRELPLRIVSWNVQGGKWGGAEAAAQLASLDPDIVFLPEAAWTQQGPIVEAVMSHPHFGEYRFATHQKRGILSRYPLKRINSAPLPARCGDAYRLEVAPSVSMTALLVHLPRRILKLRPLQIWNRDEAQELAAKTQRDVAALETLIERYAPEGPVILGGDFNLPPSYADLTRATHTLKETFAENGYGWGATAPANLKWRGRVPVPRVMQLDMIFVPRDAAVHYSGAVATPWSDHYMMLAEVTIPFAAPAADATTSAPGQ